VRVAASSAALMMALMGWPLSGPRAWPAVYV
jgi:hypothetical protein